MRKKIGLYLGIPLFLCLLLLPTPKGMGEQAYSITCIAFLMGFLWITEAIPISVTALIPLVAFPLMKVQSAAETSISYGNSHVFLFMGGFFIAIAMAKWQLQKRIALKIIHFVGTGKKRIILGFMLATAFISMWISNTATALMMYPIGIAVVHTLEEITSGQENDSIDRDGFSTAVMLAIAFSASIGGIATLIGTPPNIIFVATSRSLFPNAPEFSFADWFLMIFPMVVIFIPLSWWYMVSFGFRLRETKSIDGNDVIQEKLIELGPMKREEWMILVIFVMTVFGWIFRENLRIGMVTIPGWGDILQLNKYIHDSTVAMGAALLLFILPTDLRTFQRILHWNDARDLPWGILILFGGGIALADGFNSSGLSKWVAESLAFFNFLPPLLVTILVCVTMMILTEFTSNTATASIFMPILGGLAIATEIHPYVLMIPATIAVSCAFVLPVATPPNAIIFGSGRVKIIDMVRIGIVFDIIGLLLIVILLYCIIFPLFAIDPHGLPSWTE